MAVKRWAWRRGLQRLEDRSRWHWVGDCHRAPPSLTAVQLASDSHIDVCTDWPGAGDLSRAADFVRRSLSCLESAYLSMRVIPRRTAATPRDMEACHTVGWRYSGTPYGRRAYCPSTAVHMQVGNRTFEGESNEARIDFIRCGLAAWGVLDFVKPVPPSVTKAPWDRVWTYDARPPYFVVTYQQMLSSEIHPGIEVGFPPDMPLATARVRAWLDRMGMTPIRTRLHLGVHHVAYESFRAALAAFHAPWTTLFTAIARTDINPYADPATLPADAPDRIPIRFWNARRRLGPHRGNFEVHYFALAVRRLPDGLYLEVSSDYPDPARVKKDAEAATGLPFEIIDVCGE